MTKGEAIRNKQKDTRKVCLLFLLPLILFILSGHPVSCGVRYALSKEGRKIIKKSLQPFLCHMLHDDDM